MSKSKIYIISIGVAILAILIAGGFVFSSQFKIVKKEKGEEIKTTVTATNQSEQNCNFPKDAVKKTYFITIASSDMDAARKSIEDIIKSNSGKTTNFSDSTTPSYVPAPEAGTRNIQFTVVIPQEKFNDFTGAIDKVGASPNMIQNKNNTQEDYDALVSECQGFNRMLASTQDQLKMYENQLTSTTSFEDKQNIINRINDLKQQIFYMNQAPNNTGKDFTKTEVNISLTNYGIGG